MYYEKCKEFPSSCSALLLWKASILFLGTETAFKLDDPLPSELTSENFSRSSSFLQFRTKEMDIQYFYTELSVGNICIYEIDRRTSYPYIHDILLLTDIVLKHYTIIECLERYTVYL